MSTSCLHSLPIPILLHHAVLPRAPIPLLPRPVQPQVDLLRQVALLVAVHALGPEARLDQVAQPAAGALAVGLQHGAVDALGHVDAQGRVELARERGRELARREDEQGHGLLEVVDEGRVQGRAGRQVRGGEGKGGRDVAVGRGGAGADQLEELQAEESEVEGGLAVEDLEGRGSKQNVQGGDGSGNVQLMLILRTEGSLFSHQHPEAYEWCMKLI